MAWKLERNNLHWQYFLAIESDLIKVSRFVEFHNDNMKTFSLEFARILLATCAKVEVIGKLIADTHNSQPQNIGGIRDVLMNRYPHISAAQVSVPRYGLTLTPWDAWANGQAPSWWNSYNCLKHDYKNAFPHASLVNSLESLAGLLVLALLYCRISGADALMPATDLLESPLNFGVGAMTPNGRVIDLRNASH